MPMNQHPMDTILLVCSDEDYSNQLIGCLQDVGASVVGPVSCDEMALALAAQTSPNLAILASDPSGARDAAGLARDLHDTWGVRSVVLEGVAPPPRGEQPWLPDPEALARLRATLAAPGGAKPQ